MDSKIPNIRFKGFTDAWEQRRLGEVTIYQNGKGYEDSQSSSGKFELINLNSISIDGGLKSSGKYIESADKTLLTDDLVMVLSDVGKGDLLGRVAIIPKDNYYVLNQRYFKLHGAGMSQLNISKGSVENFPLLLPSLPEQQQIGTFFAHLDTLISLHQRKCDQTKELKKTMLQKIFPKKGETVPEIRFPEFTDAWEQRKFGELLNETRNKTTVEDEDTLLSCAIDGMFLNSELFSHFRGSSNIGYLKVKKNDLILSAQNLHLGNCNVNLRFEHGIISPAYKVYELIECDPLFMQAWVKQDKTKDFFLKASTEGASVCRKNIIWEELYKQKLPVPKITEQQKIGEYFSNLDHLITLHQRKCDELKEIKKTLLKNLFI